MAEPNPPLHHSKLPAPKLGTTKPQDRQASAKFLSSFLCKTIFFAIFITLLPLFPSQSQAPESTNQSIFGRSWELLHLLIVGIAVSYGLFSHRNTEPELDKEAGSKADSPRSYVSQILHISPVFDDDEVGSPRRPVDESRIQTWSSQYRRSNNPAVVVGMVGTNAGQAASKPLHLPVRSLKSCARASGLLGPADGIEKPGRSSSSDALNSKNETKVSAVLPSPIPWRSRSGRMEVKDELSSASAAPPPPPPSTFGADSGPSKIPSFRSPATPTPSPTPPKRLSSPPTPPLEMRKSFHASTPPPAPPPPPPPFPGHGYPPVSDKKAAMKSFKDELKDLSRRGRERSQSTTDPDPFMSAPTPRNAAEISSVGRSVRTVRPKEVPNATQDPATRTAAERSLGYEARQPSLAIISSGDSDGDDDGANESSDEEVSNSAAEAGPDENEVDKKADEFIAKFREQIRLQRIEAIKRSSGQRSLRNPK